MPLLEVPDLRLAVEAGESVAVVGAAGQALWRRLAGASPRAAGPVLYKGTDISGWSPARRRAAGLLALFQSPRAAGGLTLPDLLRPSYQRGAGRALRAELHEAAARLGVDQALLSRPLEDEGWRGLEVQAEWLQAACLRPDLVVSAAPPLRPALHLMRERGAAVVLCARGPRA